MKSDFRLRSFVRRGGGGTAGQARARATLGSKFALALEAGPPAFASEAPCYLEIGFGFGHSLLEIARIHPDYHFIGVETHSPGIGSLYARLEQHGINNIRVYEADVVDVLARCMVPASLEGVMIFFPDPWPKRRHQPRRLIQIEFLQDMVRVLKPGGFLHLATDWEEYAEHMLKVASTTAGLRYVSCDRSPYRPLVTKFEGRAIKEGRRIYDYQFNIDIPSILP